MAHDVGVIELGPRDGALDGVEQGVGINRLREDRERTAGRELAPDLLVANGGREDHRDGKASVHQCLPKLQAAHVRQGEVEDEAVSFVTLGPLKKVVRRRERSDREARRPEQAVERFADRLVVVHGAYEQGGLHLAVAAYAPRFRSAPATWYTSARRP